MGWAGLGEEEVVLRNTEYFCASSYSQLDDPRTLCIIIT